MRKLFSILTDSLFIWSRNFTLIYVFLLALLLLQMFIPDNIPLRLEMRWYLLGSALLLLFSAMMSGFYGMVRLACERFFAKTREQAARETSPVDAITLFQGFFPGVSQFLLPIVGGYLIQLGMGVLLVLPMQSLLLKYAPLLKKMSLVGMDDRMKMLTSMPMAQQDDFLNLSSMLLGAMVAFALFSLMTILWPAFVVYYRNNPFKACFRSMVQFFKDPLGMLGLVSILFGLRVPLFLLNSIGRASGNVFITLLMLLLDLSAEIFIAILVFVYVYQTAGKPVAVLDEQEPSKPLGSDDSDS